MVQNRFWLIWMTTPPVWSLFPFCFASLHFFNVKIFLDAVLCEVTENDIPRHLKIRFDEEKTADAKKKKEKLEAHLFTEVTVSFLFMF